MQEKQNTNVKIKGCLNPLENRIQLVLENLRFMLTNSEYLETISP
jgi:hypothetical protein